MTDSTDIDYGPLAGLIGTWTGDRGLDASPEPDGLEEIPYHDTLVFEGVGDVENAEDQLLAAVRYHQLVKRLSNGEVIHSEAGYWMWDARTGVIMHSLVIPRGVCVLAGGTFAPRMDEPIVLRVSARLDDPDWGIVQSPYMRDQARTIAFDHTLTIDGECLSYEETTMVEIYGQTFEHTDKSKLNRQ